MLQLTTLQSPLTSTLFKGYFPYRTPEEHHTTFDALSVVLANFVHSQLENCLILLGPLSQVLQSLVLIFD